MTKKEEPIIEEEASKESEKKSKEEAISEEIDSNNQEIIDEDSQEPDENNNLDSKITEYEELIKRQQAEFDNYRKRMIREREDFHKYAAFDVLKDLLDIKDNFERALQIEIKDESIKQFVEGFQMIEGQLTELFTKYNVIQNKGEGEEFDPNIHQSIAIEEDDEVKVDTISEVFQRGYTLHDRVLRISQVKIKQATKKKEKK